MIEITLLGTSALFPLPDRALSAAALKCNGHTVLFDCGEGTQTAARKCGVSLIKTDIIALTHYHGDHIFGLPGLLQTMLSNDRTEPLLITGPRGIKQELEPILKLAGYLGFKVELAEMRTGPLALEQFGFPHGAQLVPFKTEHRTASVGYKFVLPRAGKFDPCKALSLNVEKTLWSVLQKGEAVKNAGGMTVLPEMVMGAPRKGMSVVFSGDTVPCDSLVDASKEADLLICDGTYGENEQRGLAIEHGHCNYAMAAEMAKKANVQRLWLTHFSQMLTVPEAFLKNATDIFPFAECGKDGKTLILKFEER